MLSSHRWAGEGSEEIFRASHYPNRQRCAAEEMDPSGCCSSEKQQFPGNGLSSSPQRLGGRRGVGSEQCQGLKWSPGRSSRSRVRGFPGRMFPYRCRRRSVGQVREGSMEAGSSREREPITTGQKSCLNTSASRSTGDRDKQP